VADRTVRRELAHRVDNGISVSLFWDAVGDTLTLVVYDEGTDDYFERGVSRDRALEAFHHPYAHRPASRRTTRWSFSPLRRFE
jgi:hypothetical protein